MATSKSSMPPSIWAMRSSEPTKSAPASCASRAASPWANTATRALLPVPLGSDTVPRIIWSALRGSTPRRNAASTDSSKLRVAIAFTSSSASSGANSCSRS